MALLEVQVENKLSARLFEICALVAHNFATVRHPFHLVLEHLGGLVTDLLANKPHDVFIGFTRPASGAGDHVIVLRIADSLSRDLTIAAFNRFGSHIDYPVLSNG